jgi:FdhD protein
VFKVGLSLISDCCKNFDGRSLIEKEIQHSFDKVGLFRINSNGSKEYVSDNVIVEQPLTIMIDQVGSFTVMCTPSDIEALAVGFTFSEGMINSIEEVVATYTKPELPNVIGVEIQDPTKASIGRNLIIASSCGMCGVRNIEKMFQNIPACESKLRVTYHLLVEVMQKLRSFQRVFDLTGGSHGAAIFNNCGKIIAFAEDIGRHNALDKTIGRCLLSGLDRRNCGVALSGRVSLEIVTKAARAGIELIAAVSAVSSYAVSAAEKWNITLCGFVRPEKMNLYTKPERIIDNNEK